MTVMQEKRHNIYTILSMHSQTLEFKKDKGKKAIKCHQQVLDNFCANLICIHKRATKCHRHIRLKRIITSYSI